MQIGNISCVNLMAQPTQFGANAPPAVPNLSGIPPQAVHIVPYIAAACANHLNAIVAPQQNGVSPARIFVYNSAIANQYNNPVFQSIVALAADLVFFKYRNTNEQYLVKAASDSVSVKLAETITSIPQIQQMLDPASYQEAVTTMNNYAHAYNEINAVKGQQMNQHHQPNHHYQQPPPQQFHPQHNVAPQYGAPQQLYPPNYPQPHQQQRPPIVGNNPMYGTPVPSQAGMLQTAFGTSNVPVGKPDKYAYLVPPQGNTGIVQTSQPEVVVAESKPLVWMNSNLQAYPPAYVESTEYPLLVATIDPITTKPCAVIQIFNKEDKEMDRARHKTVVEPQSKKDFTENSGGKISATLNDAAQAENIPTYTGVNGAIDGSFDESGQLGLCSNVDEALFRARCKLQMAYRGKAEYKAHTTYNVVIKSIVSNTNYRELIERLSSLKTFAAVSQTISEAVSRTRNTPEFVAMNLFADELDEYLTDELNSLLRTRLAILTNIDSFRSDANDLFDYISKTSGEVFGSALRNYQEQFIKSVINSDFVNKSADKEISAWAGSEVSEVSDDSALEGLDTDIDFLTNINQVVSTTALGAKASDLNIGMMLDNGNIITSERFPALVNFASSLLRAARKADKHIAHHYIETSDRQVFEINEGIVGNGVILISRIK